MISLSIGSQHTARFRCAVAVCFTVQRTGSSGALAGMPKRGQYTDFGLLVVHGNHIWCSARRLAMIAYAVRERTLCGRPTESGTKTLVAALAGQFPHSSVA